MDGDDRIHCRVCGDGKHDVFGDDGDDLIYGGGGDHMLRGADGDDVLVGDSGMDYLWGDEGSDRLHAGDWEYDRAVVGGDGYDFFCVDRFDAVLMKPGEFTVTCDVLEIPEDRSYPDDISKFTELFGVESLDDSPIVSS